MSYLAFDIETVPDGTLWAPPEPEPEKLKVAKEKPTKGDLAFLKLAHDAVLTSQRLHRTDLEKAAEIAALAEDDVARKAFAPALADLPPVEEEKPFAPIYAHRTIAIGYVWLNDDFSVRYMGCAGTMQFGDDERALLEQWAAFVGKNSPTIVTWNGRGFDMPVIEMRSLRWGVAQHWYHEKYRKKYDEAHTDLKEILAPWGAKGFSLNNIGRSIGLPGKFGVDGSKVADLFAAGKAADIEIYCQGDAIMTAFVFLRFMLLRGRTTSERYQQGALGLLNACRAEPKLAEFVARIDAPKLLLQG